MTSAGFKALAKIQSELKAPKGNYNSFGKYKYRSCEDILEAVKPLLRKYNCTLVISDDVIQVGDRYYIKATTEFECEGCTIRNTAYARESQEKKGMDDSQITGTASSYARKYALNGLFLIDDTKDADTDEYYKQTSRVKEKADLKQDCLEDRERAARERPNDKITNMMADDIKLEAAAHGVSVEKVLEIYKADSLLKLTNVKYLDIMYGGHWEKMK